MSEICSAALLKYVNSGIIAHHPLTIPEYEFTLFTTLYRVEKNQNLKSAVLPHIIKMYQNYQSLDYFDLIYALPEYNDITELVQYKKEILNKLQKEQELLFDYIKSDDYGAGTYALLKKAKISVLQEPEYFSEYIKEQLLYNLCEEKDYQKVDIAIYNFARSFDYICLSRDQMKNVAKAISNQQNENGSWGGEQGFFTPFALMVLLQIYQKSNIDVVTALKLGFEYAFSNENYLQYIGSVAMMQDMFCEMEKNNLCQL